MAPSEWRKRCSLFVTLLFLVAVLETQAQQQCKVTVKASLRFNKGVVFCYYCDNPDQQGSYAETWEAHFGPKHYHVIGSVIYTVPNDARSRIMNDADIKGSIALIDRGEVAIVTKVLRAQEAGAIAVILVDNGLCKGKFDCGLLGSKSRGYFAGGDIAEGWRDVSIPVVMLTKFDGERIKSLMELISMDIGELGTQLVHPEE